MSLPFQRCSADNKHAAKGTEVFVGGLPRSISEEKINKVFSACGEIVQIRMMKDQNGNLKGFCFVRFSTKEAAGRAIREISGTVIDGKKIGVLPSNEQDTLYFGNLNKAWAANEFESLVLQVFPDVESVDLAMVKDAPPGQKHRNHGFAFVKFSSTAAAVRAQRVASQPDFRLGSLHPAVRWAEEETGIYPEELAKIKIAFVRNLPVNAEESYLKQLFEPFGKVEKAVVSKKSSFPVGFVHFTDRAGLERAVKEMNDKIVQGPSGGLTHKLQVEVARPMDRNKKRIREDSERNLSVPSHSKVLKEDTNVALANRSNSHVQQVLESADPYEKAVIALPLTVKERLLRILRLGIATRFDIDVKSLCSLKELPESIAISVLDQFMLSGAASQNKGAYLTSLISKHLVDKVGLNHGLGSLSNVADTVNESRLFSFSHQGASAVGSFPSHVHSTASRSDIYAPHYPPQLSDYPFLSRTLVGRVEENVPEFLLSNRALHGSQSIPRVGALEERSHSPYDATPATYTSYGRFGLRTEEQRLSPYGKVGLRTEEQQLSPYWKVGLRTEEQQLSPYGKVGLRTEEQQLSPYGRVVRTEEQHLSPYGRVGLRTVEQHVSPGRVGLRNDEQHVSPVQSAPVPSTSHATRLEANLSSVGDGQPPRPQIRFDPFTGEPYKFDPFTGEPIRPESATRQF